MTTPAVSSTLVEIDWSTQTVLPIELNGRELSLEARAYQGSDPKCQALVLVNSPPDAKPNSATPVVRIHSGCVTGDIFHSLRCDCYQQLQTSLAAITDEPGGILIYLPYQEGRGIGLVNKVRAYALQDQGLDTVDANVKIGAPVDARDYRFAAAILFDLSAHNIRLLTNNPSKVKALRAQGINVVEQVPVVTKPGAHNKAYLDTKRARMDHKI